MDFDLQRPASPTTEPRSTNHKMKEGSIKKKRRSEAREVRIIKAEAEAPSVVSTHLDVWVPCATLKRHRNCMAITPLFSFIFLRTSRPATFLDGLYKI